MSAENYVIKQLTFMEYIRRAGRVWQYVEQNSEPVKSVRTFVTAADNPQQQPRETRTKLRQVQFSTRGVKNKTFTLNTNL